MRSLSLPNFRTSEYLSDLYNFRDPLKIESFHNSTGLILLYERLYALKAAQGDVNAFLKGNPIENYVSKKELIELYDRKFVSGNGRDYYLELRKSVAICPSCLLKDVEEVDHYLPKSDYPILSVAASNLVPICEKCNDIKKDRTFSTALIHPYFDNISNFEWLFLDVIISNNNIGFNYYVKVPDSIEGSELIRNKIDSHMINLNLYETYNSKVSNLHSATVDALKNILDASNETVVKAALRGYYKGATKENINNLDAAFYKALLEGNYIEDYLKHYQNQ